MLYIHEQEEGLDIELYEVDNLIDKKITTSYKTELRDYNVEANFIEPDWDYEEYIEHDEFTPTSSALVETYLDRITIDNLKGVGVDIYLKQRCLKAIVGYKGEFYRGFELLFKKKTASCEDCDLISFDLASKRLLNNNFNVKRVNISIGKTSSQLIYFDNVFSRVYIRTDFPKKKSVEFTLGDFKVKGQVDLSIPREISFSFYECIGLFEVKVDNIMFYVENSLEFTVNKKVAKFEIIAR